MLGEEVHRDPETLLRPLDLQEIVMKYPEAFSAADPGRTALSICPDLIYGRHRSSIDLRIRVRFA